MAKTFEDDYVVGRIESTSYADEEALSELDRLASGVLTELTIPSGMLTGVMGPWNYNVSSISADVDSLTEQMRKRKWEIEIHDNPNKTVVKYNNKVIENVKSININQTVNGLPEITITAIASDNNSVITYKTDEELIKKDKKLKESIKSMRRR